MEMFFKGVGAGYVLKGAKVPEGKGELDEQLVSVLFFQIDEQHQELVKQGDLLIHRSLSNAGYKKVLHQLEILLNHIVDHFDAEEQILKEIGYPDYDEHTSIHKNLVQQALKLKENYQNGELKSSAFFSFIVDEIVMGHMLEEDQKFFPYIPNSKKVACSLMQ